MDGNIQKKPAGSLKSPQIETLVGLAQSGDSDAFAKLYDIFVQPIYRYVYYRTGADEAEDLTEMIFLKIWENIRQYRFSKNNFSSWVFRIAHNLVVDYYRAHHIGEELSENIEDPRKDADIIGRAHGQLNKEILDISMAKLKDRYRQILTLKYINDLSNEEIAYITGRSQASLRILQLRALRKLKYILEEMGISASDM